MSARRTKPVPRHRYPPEKGIHTASLVEHISMAGSDHVSAIHQGLAFPTLEGMDRPMAGSDHTGAICQGQAFS
ncbi:hypothetical protein NDU88_004249 [Pleurodeles waltl]|uniref:Uncharacterized protein n=1 Tax=Pleurodeles waltl TaxID=8319 RepID=A0AAV7T742_PLEWA|nr:hypothetical protein NDU88_004249 [Pleurodeles waltl]